MGKNNNMESNKMNEIYQDIAEKINDVIPDEWEKVFLYGEVLYDSELVYLYFLSKKNHELIYYLDIPEKYKIEWRIFDIPVEKLDSSILDLYNEYKKQNEKVWTNFTLILDNTGKFRIDFNYDDIYKSEFTISERQHIWEYEVMGIEPTLEEHKEIIERYLKTKQA